MRLDLRARTIPLTIVGILFLVSLILVLMAFRVSTTKEQTTIQTTYKLKGKFAHTAFGQDPSKRGAEASKAKYFANLIEAVDVSYRYRFVPAGPAGQDVEEVEITALLESPGLWEKEVVLVPKAEYRGGVDLTFPLNTGELLALGAQISKELGVGSPSSHITLKAAVHVRVPTDSGVLEDDFTQTLVVSDLGSILEWSRQLKASQKGFYKGLAYDHEGEFSYALHLRSSLAFGSIEKGEGGTYRPLGVSPPEEPEPDPVYFAKIVDSIDVSYNYRFLPEDPRLEAEAEITAVLENPGLWQKEVVLVPRTTYGDEFTIGIPLDISALQEVAAAIGEELGATGLVPRIVLKANVHIRTETPTGVQEADFVQTAGLKVGGNTLSWERGLTRSETGQWGDVTYEHQGRFDYAIRLKDNLLFGPITLRPDEPLEEPDDGEAQGPSGQILTPEVPPEEPPVPLAAKESYGRDNLDRIEVTFRFPFEADPAARKVSQTVDISGELAGQGWKETLALVPETTLTEEFVTTFPLDVALVVAIIEANDREQGVTASSHDLVITAKVHTLAETAFGPIEKELSYTMPIKFGETGVSFPETTPEETEGNIQETTARSNPSASAARMGSLGLAGIMAVVLAFVGWSYVEARRNRMTELELEAFQARRKHKDLFVDVDVVPEVEGGVLVQLSSLEELAKAAEALLKPMLHVGEPDKHIYLVVDGTTQYRYQHEMVEPPPSEPDSPPPKSPDLTASKSDKSPSSPDGRQDGISSPLLNKKRFCKIPKIPWIRAWRRKQDEQDAPH